MTRDPAITMPKGGTARNNVRVARRNLATVAREMHDPEVALRFLHALAYEGVVLTFDRHGKELPPSPEGCIPPTTNERLKAHELYALRTWGAPTTHVVLEAEIRALGLPQGGLTPEAIASMPPAERQALRASLRRLLTPGGSAAPVIDIATEPAIAGTAAPDDPAV